MTVLKNYKRWLIVCSISLLLTFCFHSLISQKIEFVSYSNGKLRIQDYAYHIIITRAFWFDSFGDIYKLTFQQQALSVYVGTSIYNVMPIGITPIALVVWFPFAYVAGFSMALSYTLWVTFSIGILSTALWRVRRYVIQVKKLELLPITLSLVTIFSATTFFAIIHGQTSVLAAGLLIYLIYFVHKTAESFKTDSWLPILFIIFLLGIKPTYLALGLSLLIIYGRWRETLYSIFTVFVLLMGITPMLTLKWVPSYLNLLQMYSHGNFSEFYAWAIVPKTMNIFRSAFGKIIGNNLAGLVSTIVNCCIFIGVIGYSIFVKIRENLRDQFSPIRITKEQALILLAACYLLFAPYAGAYEDVLFLPVFSTVLLVGKTPDLTNYKSLVLIFALCIILFQSCFPPDKPLWLFWILKALIFGYVLNFFRAV